MGSDLYACVERQSATTYVWWEVARTRDLARGIIVDAFGDCDPTSEAAKFGGYLTHDEWVQRQEHAECPWRLDEPYWVRLIPGEEFVAIVFERRWQTLQDGDFRDLRCSPELNAVAAMVESLLTDGVPVRVWCWHSQ